MGKQGVKEVLIKLGVQSVLAVAAHATAHAQITLGVSLGDIDGAAVFDALAQECYESGMVSHMPSDSIMDCMDQIEEPVAADADAADAAPVTVRTNLRFTLIERGGQGRIAGDAWTETDELGTVIEEPITSEHYLRRVQGVLSAVVTRLGTRSAPPWAGRYDSERDARVGSGQIRRPAKRGRNSTRRYRCCQLDRVSAGRVATFARRGHGREDCLPARGLPLSAFAWPRGLRVSGRRVSDLLWDRPGRR